MGVLRGGGGWCCLWRKGGGLYYVCNTIDQLVDAKYVLCAQKEKKRERKKGFLGIMDRKRG